MLYFHTIHIARLEYKHRSMILLPVMMIIQSSNGGGIHLRGTVILITVGIGPGFDMIWEIAVIRSTLE